MGTAAIKYSTAFVDEVKSFLVVNIFILQYFLSAFSVPVQALG